MKRINHLKHNIMNDYRTVQHLNTSISSLKDLYNGGFIDDKQYIEALQSLVKKY